MDTKKLNRNEFCLFGSVCFCSAWPINTYHYLPTLLPPANSTPINSTPTTQSTGCFIIIDKKFELIIKARKQLLNWEGHSFLHNIRHFDHFQKSPIIKYLPIFLGFEGVKLNE